jgi:hypothetical protein
MHSQPFQSLRGYRTFADHGNAADTQRDSHRHLV